MTMIKVRVIKLRVKAKAEPEVEHNVYRITRTKYHLYQKFNRIKGNSMTEQNKKCTIKNIMMNLGIMLVLVGSTAVKGDNLTFFFMGLILLALQIFDFKGVAPTKLIMAGIMLSATLAIAAITQLVMSKSFSTPQAFMVVLLLGVILIIVDSIHKFVELG